jgi:hypothetical protein
MWIHKAVRVVSTRTNTASLVLYEDYVWDSLGNVMKAKQSSDQSLSLQ